MPLYEYQCEECQAYFDEIRSWKDPIPDECPECHTTDKDKLKKLISLPAKGKVELYGQDLKAKLQSDTNQLRKEIYSGKNEDLVADIVGPKYHENLIKESKD